MPGNKTSSKRLAVSQSNLTNHVYEREIWSWPCLTCCLVSLRTSCSLFCLSCCRSLRVMVVIWPGWTCPLTVPSTLRLGRLFPAWSKVLWVIGLNPDADIWLEVGLSLGSRPESMPVLEDPKESVEPTGILPTLSVLLLLITFPTGDP